MSYVPPAQTLNATWEGRLSYVRPSVLASAAWEQNAVYPTPYIATQWGDTFVTKQQFIDPSGWDSKDIPGIQQLRVTLDYEYPPPFEVVNASWVGKLAYTAPASVIEALWTKSQGPAENQFADPQGVDTSLFGGLTIWTYLQYVAPDAIAAQSVPNPTAFLYTRYVSPPGVNVSRYGTANIKNNTAQLFPSGIAAPAASTGAVLELYWRYVLPPGFAASGYGDVYVQGGSRYITPNGLSAPTINNPTVVNTKADQTAKPSAIAPIAVPQPSVSPRSLRPTGIQASAYGAAFVRMPPRPAGFDASRYGEAAIEFKTKTLLPPSLTKVDPFGIPLIRDRAQKVYPPSFLQVGVFGDTLIANTSAVLRPTGWQSSDFSTWTELVNTRRLIPVTGFDAGTYGQLDIQNATPSIAPHGFDALSVTDGADTGIGYSVRYIFSPGADRSAVGVPGLTKTPSFAPVGFNAQAFGEGTIWHHTRIVIASAGRTDVYGDSFVDYRYRHIKPSGPQDDKYGTPKAEHGRRELLIPGFAGQKFGAPAAGLMDRTISPVSIWTNWPSAHQVGNHRTLLPEGFDATRFGSRIIPEIQSVYPQGFRELYGQTIVYNLTTHVRPQGFLTAGIQPQQRWGSAVVYNSRQYIVQQFDLMSGLVPPAWPQWTLVENRNRTIRTSGGLMQRMGLATIDNKARPVLPVAIEAPATGPFYKAGLVAYRIRSVAPEVMEPPYMGGWHVVVNDAAVLKPEGIKGEGFGSGALANTRRYFPYITAGDQSSQGAPMVAYAVRSLVADSRYAIHPPLVPMPEVKLHTRHVTGIGTDMLKPGFPNLAIHWTIIAPRWTHKEISGTPYVWNVTPEVRARQFISEEYGVASIRLQWRGIQAFGADSEQFGKPVIADRNRSMTVTGFRAGTVSDKLVVTKTGAPPYTTQFIWLYIPQDEEGEQKPGISYGIAPPFKQVSEEAGLNQSVLYVEQEEPSTLFGDAFVSSNGIRVPVGMFEYEGVSKPRVQLYRRFIQCDTSTEQEPYLGMMPQDVGKPRLSPHTIYACVEAPWQAVLNHYRSSTPLHVIDDIPGGRGPDIQWGNLKVENQHRTVRPSGVAWYHDRTDRLMPVPSIVNARHVIKPFAINSMRMGQPDVPGDKHITFYAPFVASLFGAQKVERGAYRGPVDLAGQGIAPPGIAGQHDIGLYTRDVKPAGTVMTRMGTKLNNDKPYMWQGLRIGPHVPLVIGGGEMDRHGTQWVSLRVRELQAHGDDHFLSEYDIDNFSGRMRVTRTGGQTIQARTITPVGIQENLSGAANVMNLVHYIRPDGNADQHRKGAF